MASQGAPSEIRLALSHSVIVLIATVDRRILPALQFVSRLPYAEATALHVSFDADVTRRLAHDWMRLGLTWLPLEIREATKDDLVGSIGEAVRDQARGKRTVTVVVPELEWPRLWHRFLHRGMARRLAAQIQAHPNITAVIVPLAWPASADGPASS